MAKIKLTKGELKRQRDALRQYERYLPTLQLKKQQLQMEILAQLSNLEERELRETEKRQTIEIWAGLLKEQPVDIKRWIAPKQIICGAKNIAGVDLAVFERIEFDFPEYDLFITPLWLDTGIETLRELVSLREEIKVIEKGVETLRYELRITTQRVNLFEKVKIPEAQENIRLIKIYVGDQMSNAVGRSKIAKRKIERLTLEEALL